MCNHILIQLGCKDKKTNHVSVKCHRLSNTRTKSGPPSFYMTTGYDFFFTFWIEKNQKKNILWHQFSCLVMSESATAYHNRPGLLVHHELPELTQLHVHRLGDAIQPSHPLSSPSPLAFSLSQHQVFSNESALHIRWPKYWSCSFNISPSNEHPGLISFKMDWLDLLAVQGTLKGLLQQFKSNNS